MQVHSYTRNIPDASPDPFLAHAAAIAAEPGMQALRLRLARDAAHRLRARALRPSPPRRPPGPPPLPPRSRCHARRTPEGGEADDAR
jgi:hypothetical protein